MLCMATCAVCSKKLQPTWKYCIYCGAAVESAAAATAPTPVEKPAKKSAKSATAEQIKVPVEEASAEVASTELVSSAAMAMSGPAKPSATKLSPAIPSAIRPDEFTDDDLPIRPARTPPLALFGWIVASIGFILLVSGIVIFLSNRH
jgi:hypothetical protein